MGIEKKEEYLSLYRLLIQLYDAAIKNDAQELTTWSSYLKPGGRILITVPAHKNKFGREDEAVGHIRRYEKLELRQLLEESGYDNIKILNMGFPLGNLTRIIGKLFVKNKKSQTGSQEEKSIKSGLERTEAVNKLSFLFNSITLLPFNFLQIVFFDKDWGDGYVAHATRKHIGT